MFPCVSLANGCFRNGNGASGGGSCVVRRSSSATTKATNHTCQLSNKKMAAMTLTRCATTIDNHTVVMTCVEDRRIRLSTLFVGQSTKAQSYDTCTAPAFPCRFRRNQFGNRNQKKWKIIRARKTMTIEIGLQCNQVE